MGAGQSIEGPQGEPGAKIINATATASGLMTLSLSDGTSYTVQLPKGPAGTSVKSVSMDSNGKLVFKLVDDKGVETVSTPFDVKGERGISIANATATTDGLMTIRLSDGKLLDPIQLPKGIDGKNGEFTKADFETFAKSNSVVCKDNNCSVPNTSSLILTSNEANKYQGIKASTDSDWLRLYGTSNNGVAVIGAGISVGYGGLNVNSKDWTKPIPGKLIIEGRDILAELDYLKGRLPFQDIVSFKSTNGLVSHLKLWDDGWFRPTGDFNLKDSYNAGFAGTKLWTPPTGELNNSAVIRGKSYLLQNESNRRLALNPNGVAYSADNTANGPWERIQFINP